MSFINPFSSSTTGPALYGASVIVKQFPVRHCGHEKKPIGAGKCLSSLVRNHNKHHLIIATQDKSLVNSLREIPEVPIITLKGNAITLLKPPKDLTESVNHVSSNAALAPAENELEQLRQLKTEILGENEEQVKKRKRKRPKAPNPLSCKSKKKRENHQRDEGKKQKRKRVRNMPRNVAKLLESAKNNKE